MTMEAERRTRTEGWTAAPFKVAKFGTGRNFVPGRLVSFPWLPGIFQ